MRLMAGFLTGVAHQCVHACQRGFLGSRHIEECLFDVEVSALAWGPAHRKACLVLFDVERAFPSLFLEFIFRILEGMRMPEWCLRALKAAYRSQRMAFELSGFRGEWFSLTRGLRQGCPCSGVLFALALDPIARWMIMSLPPSGSLLSLYADDIAIVIEELDCIIARLLNEFARILALAAGLQISYGKSVFTPLHHDGVGCIRAPLCEIASKWRQCREEVFYEYLGFVVGPGMSGHVFEKGIKKLEARAAVIRSMSIGSPASLYLAKVLIWSCVTHLLSLHAVDDRLARTFKSIGMSMVRGPAGWITWDVAKQLRLLKWPAAPPDPTELAERLQLFMVLCHLDTDFELLWAKVISGMQHEDAALLPLTWDWSRHSYVLALAEASRKACLNGIVRRRRSGRLVYGPVIGDVGSFSIAKQKYLKWLKRPGGPILAGKEILRAWLLRSTALVWGAWWNSHSRSERLLRWMVWLSSLVAPKYLNSTWRIFTGGVVLNGPGAGHACLLCAHCEGGNTLQHFVSGSCWKFLPQVRAKFGPVLNMLNVPFERRDRGRAGLLASLCWVLVTSINYARTRDRGSGNPMPILHFMRHHS